ncbi:hypothetical protein Hanom_Chr14g01255071 [Helianthus anomalus]
MPLPRLELGTSGKRWVSVANWATPVSFITSFFINPTYQFPNSSSSFFTDRS